MPGPWAVPNGAFAGTIKEKNSDTVLSCARHHGRLRAGPHRPTLANRQAIAVVSGLVRRGQTCSEYRVRCRLRTAERSARPLESRY
jgi:hypothetical protein